MPLPIRPIGCVTGQKEKKEEKKREGVSLLLLLYLVGDTVFHPPSSLISIVYPLAHHLACSLRIAISCETRLDRTAILNRAMPNNVLFIIKFLLESYDGKRKKRRLRGKGVPETTLKGCGAGVTRRCRLLSKQRFVLVLHFAMDWSNQILPASFLSEQD